MLLRVRRVTVRGRGIWSSRRSRTDYKTHPRSVVPARTDGAGGFRWTDRLVRQERNSQFWLAGPAGSEAFVEVCRDVNSGARRLIPYRREWLLFKPALTARLVLGFLHIQSHFYRNTIRAGGASHQCCANSRQSGEENRSTAPQCSAFSRVV